ncbi:hypothetical protein [Streptomyces sp. NPDC060184]|uniref:hypothetical protein n=1 Tax=Streptomyces sp. NPDC060184 TaxID=3347064 RepID=UPI0036581463
MWIQTTPLATQDDATAALQAANKRLLGNPSATVRVVSEIDVNIPPINGANSLWARRQQVRPLAGTGEEGVALLLGAAIDCHVLVLGLSGTPSWDWESASDIASRQAALLTGKSH